MVGAWDTVNEAPLLVAPLTVTTTLPEVAPPGTIATIEVAVQVVTVAETPLNATELAPCVESKFTPVIATESPGAPTFGVKLAIDGATTGGPKLTVTLSNTAVAVAEAAPLFTAKPTNTFEAVLMV